MAAAAGASTRCPRPDCTALREELELVRGDLLELEGEGETLHERVAALEGERGDLRARHERALADKDEDVRRLSALVQDLTAQLSAAATATAAVATSSPAAATPSNKESEELERVCADLRDKNRVLETQLSALQASVAKETAASSAAVEQVARIAQESKDKRGELYKALQENEVLRGELTTLRSSLRSVSEKATVYETSIRGLHAQLDDYRSAVDEQTLEITQLHSKLERLEREKEVVEAKLIEMDEKESDVEALTQQARAAFDLEKAGMQRELVKMRDEVRRLQEQQQQQHEADVGQTNEQSRQRPPSGRARSASLDADDRDVREMAKQLELLQELRIRDKNTILELNQRILQQQSDLTSLAEHVDTIGGDSAAVEKAVQAAVKKEAEMHAATHTENSKLLRRLKEQSALVRDLEGRQGELERQLNDAQAWNARYECGAGLEDVMKFQKQLRKELEKQQQANMKLRNELNEQIEAAGRLHASFERLKEETGRPPTFQYDDMVVAEHLQGQVAVHRAVMAQMEQQVQELEAERVRLLQRLRDQARVTGSKLYEAHGLTMEQWEVVEEFMDQLKHTPEVAKRVLVSALKPSADGGDTANARHSAHGTRESPRGGEDTDGWELVVKSDAENARLVSEVARLRKELEVAKAEAASARANAVAAAAAAPRDGGQPHDPTLQDRDAEVLTLRTSIRSLQLQCDALMEELETTKRALKLENEALVAAKAAAASSVGADSAPVDADAETKAAPRARRGVSSRGTQTIGAATTENAVTAKQQREKSDRAAENSAQAPRNYDSSAECIAQTVVKALEAQLALLKHTAAPRSVQSSLVQTAAGADSTTTRIETEDTRSSPSTARSKTPRGKAVEDAAPASDRCEQGRATPDPMAIASDEDLAKQIDYLKELNVCLDELAQAEVREEALETRLHEHEDAFQSLMDQHTVLYAHFFHMHAQYSAAESKLRREREQLEATNREWGIKCQRLEAGLHAVGGADPLDSAMLTTEAQLRAQVAHLTRQMAEFEVNDARWKRSCRHLQEELRASAGRNAMLANEWLEMEKALKFRILYLESWKQGADDMMERMDTALGASVLKRVSDRQQQALVEVLCKYRDVSSAYADVRVKYLELYDLPIQLSKAQHRLELLEAERRARTSPGESESAASKSSGNAEKKAGGDKQGGLALRALSADPILQARIAELELELQAQVNRVKELENDRASKFQELEAGDNQDENSQDWQKVLVLTALNGGEPTDHIGNNDSALAAENSLLYERINEVEQLYDALTRECAKYKDVASLAASQANVLSKKVIHAQKEREDDVTRRRQLAAASEDHSLVGHLQLELMQLRTTYQQFALKHDLVVESQQRALLERQQLELAVERSAKELADVRGASRLKVLRLEATLTEVGTRDLTARNAKWDAFRKRLDSLEDDLRAEHTRRKQLELELEDNTQQPSARDSRGGATVAMAEVSRLRSRVEELETRERALIGQLEALAASNTNARSPSREQMLRDELEDAKTLNEDLLRQVQAEHARVTDLLTQLGTLERDHRELRAQKEDVELELRHRLQQLDCDGDDNQRQHARESDGPGSPVLMRKKVGLYEQDQAQLQQAAQATIASLKQLVEDKNELVREYQQKLAAIRAEVAQSKSQDRADASKLHKQLYDENQRVIAQLQDATATIRQLERSGKDKRALQAAQERHEQVLRSWKQSEMALEEARQKIRELQGALEVITNERDLAEARAGEALEEIVTLQSEAEERGRHVQQLEQRVGAARGEMKKKDEKLQLLRDAIIKLKEEFLKAEDRHAVEIARAQHALTATQLDSSRRKKKTEEQEEQEDEWRDEKQRLEAQVKILQDKLALERSKSSKKGGDRQKQRQQQREAGEEKEDGEIDVSKVKTLEAEVKARAKEVEALAREVERLKAKVKEQAVSEARTVDEFERKFKVIQAQNVALREAAKPVGVVAGDGTDHPSREEREQLQAEADAATEAARKLQRRVDVLTSRLKEQQESVAAKEEELAAVRARVQQQQQELKRRQQREEKQAASGTSDKRDSDKWKAQASDLQRQNAFLQETLVLKRSEWEDALRDQMARYEEQVARLRQRLSRRYGLHRDGSDNDGNDGGGNKLEREEARFLASQEVKDELTALGEELRTREQQDMAKDTKLLELELETETLRVECQRLQRFLSASKPTQDASQSSASRGRAAESSRSALRSDFHERAALEQVIENMKKVIEKLRSENDKLRRAQGALNGTSGVPVTADQFERLRRQLREHKDARGRLEAQVEELQREMADLKKQKLRLQQKLRAATASNSTASTAEKRLQDKDVQLRATERALAEANATIAQREEELQRLQDEIDQLELEARSPVTEARDPSGRVDELEEQIAALEDENTRLTNELAAFDGEFFEEIEDLKYKYAEAIRDKRALERRLLQAQATT